MNMLHVLRQTVRGCGTLPHLGDHPRTLVLVVICSLGAVAGGLVGAAILAVGFGIPYLLGAYDRAEYSDQIERGEENLT
jgi:hypothetical protein